jgi:dienelactone hydrolase
LANFRAQTFAGRKIAMKIAVISVRPLFIFAACLPLLACVASPSSRTASESSNPVSLVGYTVFPGQTITIQAVDQNTGNLVIRGTATSATSGVPSKTPAGTNYVLYRWSFDAGVLPLNFWAPQSIVPNLATSQGHLEIFASADGNNLYTFSPAAWNSLAASGEDPLTAGVQYSDGKSTVLFDQDGVGSGPETSWVNVQGMISNPSSSSFSPVAWSVGYYTVEGGKKIYGLICSPTTGGPYPVVIYNHGGLNSSNGGNITGVVTSSGWTSQPPTAPDGLGQCLDWAKRGWVVAMSSYRGENVNIASASPAFPAPATPWTSDGSPEFCMGEVTDVLALTDLVVNHASSITVGSTSEKVPINVNGKVLMYGYSHGGCITYRAVEQGAPVTAFSVIEGFTDLSLNYLNWTSNGQSPANAAVAAGAITLGGSGYYLPDANGVMGYNWRSAHYFASRGDLSIQKFKTMPILIFHGDVDFANPVFLDEAAEIATDIGAANIFVGPNGFSPPASEPCIAGTVGAPIPNSVLAPTALCPISFMPMNTGDPCVSGSTVPAELALCSVVPLPLPPPPGQAQQLHYMVVYHNMNHTNGGLAIKETFNRFVELNFARHPGCDGLEIDCATD